MYIISSRKKSSNKDIIIIKAQERMWNIIFPQPFFKLAYLLHFRGLRGLLWFALAVFFLLFGVALGVFSFSISSYYLMYLKYTQHKKERKMDGSRACCVDWLCIFSQLFCTHIYKCCCYYFLFTIVTNASVLRLHLSACYLAFLSYYYCTYYCCQFASYFLMNSSFACLHLIFWLY